MRRVILLLLFSFIFFCSACSASPALTGATPTPTPTASGGDVTLPSGGATASDQASSAPSSAPTSALYDPSIFVIKASGKWRKELAEGYYADYECEIYLHKIDANDNRQVTGTYQGTFWMNVTIDADEFIDDLLKNVPVELTFGAGGEAVSDNFGIHLNTTDDKAWTDYNITGEDGKALPLTRDMPVAKGSFVTIAKNMYLQAKGSGAQGEKIDYSDIPEDQQMDMSYIVHVEPDSAESGNTRKVVFLITDSNGTSLTVEGTLVRLPGYPDDVSDYLNSSEYQDASQKHLE
jgi:hypothetical protein